ncbi:hypothetical protein O3P69_000787 [Scylla paramamosain]|uniref:Uncharacterized protein n=1 Tax=Scylla paramamosain TaxID=85552 RepID=A0AAW0URA6_SCYPA
MSKGRAQDSVAQCSSGTMAIKTLLLLLAATLIQAALGFRLEESDPSQAHLEKGWPCPNITEIDPSANAFYKNKNLKYLDLSHNSIETLYKDSLKFQSPIQEIKLNSNNIHTVEVGAISGLGKWPVQTFLWDA